ncbi:hypothetical protein [Desulfonema magnum]|uniref:Uncharacterized protein n=1 Tax=Desulfonema magnum TaxID=45655 RepID=A0A975BT23_9BACT|nr:hypothetical protein [Desulfonema magnum]QTA90699.1 Uncharacterized protein dnm_067600 [Desulfonema magnum]
MELKTVFDIPDHIYAGILKGKYVRTGGVIQGAAGTPEAGNVVMWLREISSGPLPSDSLMKSSPFLPNALGMAGSVASILNLGATVCFGIKILKKLGSVEQKMDHLDQKTDHLQQTTELGFASVLNQLGAIEQKADHLQWTVELGFASVLNQLDRLAEYHEAEIIAELKTAAELSWTAQFLEPDSQQRIFRIEQALAMAAKSLEKLTVLAKNSLNDNIENFRRGAMLRNADESVISNLQRLRQAILALSLRASIHAEAGDFKSCSQRLENLHREFKSLFIEFGHAFFRGRGKGLIYDDLLNKSWKGVISPQRVDIWSRRFDRKTKGIFNILEEFRGTNVTMTSIDKDRPWAYSTMKNIPVFCDLLDGIYEDLERLEGHLAEYKNAASQDLSVHEYRKMLEIKEIQEEENLAFLVKK